MAAGLSLSHALEHRLDHSQELQLKQLLELRLELRAPEIPNATRGLEGMRVADELLKQRRAAGVLVGGVLEDIWARHTGEYLIKHHKDVDVAVLNPEFELEERFEGGIDWWLRRSATVDAQTDISRLQVQQEWFVNGNGVHLSFNVFAHHLLQPGLYIPSKQFVVDMRIHEALVRYQNSSVTVDPDVLGEFEARLSERASRMSNEVREAWGGNVLQHQGATGTGYRRQHIEPHGIILDEISRDVLSAIKAGHYTEGADDLASQSLSGTV